MKKILLISFIFSMACLVAQPGLYRQYPQTAPQYPMGYTGNPQKPVPTADGGYLISNWLLYMGFESPGGLGASYTIKTDSAFVPQWKKNYAGALALPTGGIILYNGSTIEKVTASGAQVWIKHLSTPIMLNDAVLYGNKVRFVGNLRSYVYLNYYAYTSDGFTLLTDTNGTYTSHSLFHSSLLNSGMSGTYRASADFSKIKRDSQGNFLVYSRKNTMYGIGSQMSIAKFDTSFTFMWAKTWGTNTHMTQITDIDILPNGRIFASAITPGNSNSYWISRAALLKMDAQGNLVSQCFFQNRVTGSELTKKANGNYVLNLTASDSVFMLETDTSMNVQWLKYVAKGRESAGPVIRHTKLYTPIYNGLDMIMISNDLSGSSCSSYSMSYTKPTTTISLVNFTLTPVSYTTSLGSGTINSISSQTYVDSCKCPVFIPNMQSNLCVGHTATINIIGTGNLSWYGSATGNNFIQSGSQYTFASMSPTTVTVYAQDSACGANPNRTAVSITVHAVPTLSFSPANPMICYGQQVFVTAMGAPNYTWSHNLSNSYVQNLNPLTTTVYTVTGSAATGCTDTKTLAVTVVPAPTVSANSSGSICAGQTATISASGGTTYTWNNGQTGASFTVSPAYAGQFNYNVAGSNNVCNGYATAVLVVGAIPSLSVVPNPALLCAGKTATLTASGATSYSWSTGGTGSSLLTSPSTSTTYYVTGITNGCVGTGSVTVPVQTPPLVSALSSASAACMGSQVSFSASGANSYTWSNGQTTSTFSLNAPGGLNSFTVTGTDGTCTAKATVVLNGLPNPTIQISTPAVLCQGQTASITANGAATYSWSNGSTGPTLTVTPAATGIYIFNVTGSDGMCSSSAQASLTTMNTPTVLALFTPAQPCAGDTVTITVTGANTYAWNNGFTGQVLIFNPPVNTGFVISGSDNGCTSTASLTIPVKPLPNLLVISSQTAVCEGAPITLTATGANSYTWSNGVMFSSINITPTISTVYSVTGVLNNCFNSTTATVVVNPLPLLTVNSDSPLICAGEQVSLNASGANLYIWNSGAVGASIIVNPAITSNYTVQGTSAEGCQTTAVFTQSVSPCTGIDRIKNDIFQVLPNPTTGPLQILSPGTPLEVRITDVTGRVVCSSAIHEIQTQLDMSSYANGLYVICVFEKNQIIFQTRIIKE